MLESGQVNYVINLNTNLVHKMSCHTIPTMSPKNKSLTSDSIEKILEKGYIPCKNCRPDRDAKYVINEDIREFEKTLHNEFGFGENYTDKVLRCLSNLYEGISAKKKNYYDSTKEYHRITANICYKELGWMMTAGLDTSIKPIINNLGEYFKSIKINNKSYFDSDSIIKVYKSVQEQHIKAGKGENKNDFAHMSATISTHFNDSKMKTIAQYAAKQFNGISDIDAQSGYIGDVCGTNNANPSMGNDDYRADLDAVNLFYRYIKYGDKTIYSIFVGYYQDLSKGTSNRASEFLENVSIETIKEYRKIYSNFLYKDANHKYNKNDEEYIKRMELFDAFINHLNNREQSFDISKYKQGQRGN